ncbi:aldose epimerase family protein [Psychrilyobacter atlanticus]|uniref:aldose epimerase family protein n=1 Tax=Psychrilyobacter atlanticus TaxID=271091 RepID=UPI000419A9EF|nr:aldose epimerase family protein [Psychrilyobacter atlanticus]
MKILRTEFGVLKTGEEVFKYILKNDRLEVSILNYGGIITEILMADRDRKKQNVVLGYDNIRDYEEKSPYFGAIIGRIAGRIEGGSFELGGVRYNLAVNNGKNNLHGGIKGLDKRIWDVFEVENGIELSYTSPHMEEGFPSKVEFKVRYTLLEDTLEISYLGTPDRDTILNLTNHSYFNLSGDCQEDILDHELCIEADRVSFLDGNAIPHGQTFNLTGTPFNFKTPKKIGKDIDSNNLQLRSARGYDHPFILKKEKELEISLFHEKTGRKLDVYTDQKAVVLYTGNYLGDNEGKLSCGVTARPRLGVCLETQDLPNHINVDEFKTTVYTPDNPYRAVTRYVFTNS